MRWRRFIEPAQEVVGLWVLRPQRINDEADNAGPDDGDDNPEGKQSANKVHPLSPARRVASSLKKPHPSPRNSCRIFSRGVVADQANSAAPDSVSFTYVPLSWIKSQPCSIVSLRPAPYSAGPSFCPGIGAERLPNSQHNCRCQPCGADATERFEPPLPEGPMITRWYIEAREGESWRDVSKLFMEWLQKNASLKTFGFSEGDAVEYSGKRLYNFRFPAHHGENISLFKTWAETTGRLFGGDKDGTVHLNNNRVLTLPPKAPPPPWLR